MKRQDKENNLINNLEGLNKVILSSARFENENQVNRFESSDCKDFENNIFLYIREKVA